MLLWIQEALKHLKLKILHFINYIDVIKYNSYSTQKQHLKMLTSDSLQIIFFICLFYLCI